MVAFSKLAGAAAFIINYATAHSGESHNGKHMKRELVARDKAAALGARSINGCSNSVASRTLHARSLKRRAETVKSLRAKRGIKAPARKAKRSLEDLQNWETINHNMTDTYNYNMFTPLEEVFSANTSCILAPYITDGPYYVVGEYMRSNVKEAEFCDGIDVFLEVQYIDVNTCNAVPSVAVDIWNCNATGTYSGVESGQAGLDTTFLRGIQLTDHDGVASFETIFPGHYEGRAIHTHLLAHTNASVQSNGTISVWGAPVAHIGQLFWPEDLRAEIEATEPYTSNTQSLTTNNDDMWSILAADENFDPIPQFVYLGDSIEDGLFAWIQIGINASADYTDDDYYSIAAYLDAEGGHAQPGGFAGGNSTGRGPSGIPGRLISGAPSTSAVV
ncbi:Intradiol ring-cleavage dioxygenase [Biscogniauxia marginata]|nr:Intradiol ring-cleavage dioxygenase [Biscogniauxia marginata]